VSACRGIETDDSAAQAKQREARRHRDLDAADADAHERAELEQLETNRAAACVGKGRIMQPDPAQSAEQHVGHRREPQAQLVGSRRSHCSAIFSQPSLSADGAHAQPLPATLGARQR
jgi:hypothetical protein